MLLKTAICDDESRDSNTIKELIHKYEIKYDIDFDIHIFNNPNRFIESFNTSNSFNIVFMDIEMPELNGLDLAHIIRNKISKDIKIVFVSSYPQYMQDSFPVHPVNYLTKPITYDMLERVMNQIVNEIVSSSIHKILVKSDSTEEMININNIIYIEKVKSKKNTLIFHTEESNIESIGMLKNYEQALISHQFFSPRRGYLINLKYIHYIKDNSIVLLDGTILSVSRRNLPELHRLVSREFFSFEQ